MKKSNVFLLIFITVFGCENEPFEGNLNEINSIERASFQVDFDGQTFMTDNTSATITDGNTLNIIGLKTNNQESITLRIFGVTEGIYNLGVINTSNQVNTAVYLAANQNSNPWQSFTDGVMVKGKVTISKIDTVKKTISGTFNFVGQHITEGEKEFVNGIFTNISFTEIQTENSSNSFFAKVDGVEFVEDLIQVELVKKAGITTISIVASKNNLETISFKFDVNIAVGDYSFGNIDTIPVGIYSVSANESFVADGKFTITGHGIGNRRIFGTFNFEAQSVLGDSSVATHQITEGSFDVFY